MRIVNNVAENKIKSLGTGYNVHPNPKLQFKLEKSWDFKALLYYKSDLRALLYYSPDFRALLYFWKSELHICEMAVKSNQTKLNQIKPNQTKPNQIKPNQTKPNQIKSNKIK